MAHMECTLGILSKAKGQTRSAFQQFKDILEPDYHVQLLEVDAGKTISPLGGAQSPLRHIRAHVCALRKDLFPGKKNWKFTCNLAEPRRSFDAELDHPEEAEEYRLMPTEDQRAFVFNYRRTSQGAAYLGHILEPSEPLGESRGHHLFLTEAVDPLKGRAPPWTATGGGGWITRSVNGKQSFRLPTNREGARLYCLETAPPECFDDRSYLGQAIIGNAIPLNVADDLYSQFLLSYSRVQSDGLTAQEKWLRQLELRGPAGGSCSRAPKTPSTPTQPRTGAGSPPLRPTVGGRKGSKRKEIPLSPKLELKIKASTSRVFANGKAPATVVDYNRSIRQWENIAQQKGWDSDLTQIITENPEEATRRIMLWLGYEKEVHHNKADTLRHKLSAVRFAHLRRHKPDPFKTLDSVKQWLADLGKIDGPSECKLPVPFSLLLLIFELLDPLLPESLDARVKKTALLTGFWWALRSSEYLAADSGVFNPNRALTWDDVSASVQHTRGWAKTSLKEALSAQRRGLKVRISLTLFSSKNKQETCTRTLTAVPGGDKDCPVTNLLELFGAKTSRLGDTPAGESAVFELASGRALSRAQVSDILKQAATVARIPAARIASHSLRRGGASAYVAAGASDEAIQRFGRWTSDAYKAYVFPHAAELESALRKAMVTVPCFERN